MVSAIVKPSPPTAAGETRKRVGAKRVVHLPVYVENAYQPLLMSALGGEDLDVIPGGGGGNFFRSARFRWQADLFHFHWLHPYILRPSAVGTLMRGTRFLAEIAALKRAGKGLVWTVHNLQNHDHLHIGIERFISCRFVRKINRVIVHSGAAKRAAMKQFRIRGSDRFQVIPHGNYVGHYRPSLDRFQARKKLGIEGDRLAFLLFGRLHDYKGLMDLLQAFEWLGLNSTLVMAGAPKNDATEQLLRKLCGHIPNVIFHPGYVPDEMVSDYFLACDVVVLPYHDVLTSGTAILAMSFAKPCIVPALDGLLETFTSAGAFFYEAGNREALADAMRVAVEQRNQLARMGEANLARARAWTWTDIALQTRGVYEQALKEAIGNSEEICGR